jgi:hypothetical protein
MLQVCLVHPTNRTRRRIIMDTRPVSTTSGIGRRAVLTAGAGAALALATLTESVEAGATAKAGWRYCPKCRGLFAGTGTKSAGVCPAGGTHTPVKAYSYLLLSGLSVTNPQLYKNFFQCKKCRGLFADDLGDTGVCPKGGAHSGTGPACDLWAGTSLPFMEANWRECLKCSGLYWAGSDNGVCPTGAGHQPGADVYTLIWLL